MITVTLTTKKHITRPVQVWQALNVDAGDSVELVEIEPGRYELVAATRTVKELKGMFGRLGRSESIEGMNNAIEQLAGSIMVDWRG